MTEEKLSNTVKNSLILLLIKELWPFLISAIPTILTYLYLKGAKVIDAPFYIKYSLVILAILLGTSIFFFIKWLRLYLRYERYHQAFGVLWDKNFRMHCLNCHKPLKYSSHDPSILNCSAKKCDNKHVLRDKLGQKITELQAIELIKNSQQIALKDVQKATPD
jgi:hypothetical protein